MLGFFNDVNPIVLDTLFVSIIVLIAFFGVIKGIKKVVINFMLAGVSFVLAFSSVTASLKLLLTDKVMSIDTWIPADSSNVLLFFTSFFSIFVSSIVLFALFYTILCVMKILFKMMIERRNGGFEKRKTILERILGGVFSFVYGGVVVLALTMLLNNNIVGMQSLIKKSTITNFVVDETQKIINKNDKQAVNKMVLKIYKGDIFASIDGDKAEAFSYINENAAKIVGVDYQKNVENESLENEQVKVMVKEYILLISETAILLTDFDEASTGLNERFLDMSEELITIINKKVDGLSLGSLQFTTEEHGSVKMSLKEAGMSDEWIALVDEIIEGK